MKKIALVLALFLVASAPVLADGYHKKSGKKSCKKSECKLKKAGCSLIDGTVWLIKLPFRLVTSTLIGTVGILTDQDLEGFERGYDLI